MIGRKGSFEAVPKNSQPWSWGDIRWQTVPDAASSHRKRTPTVDSRVRRITAARMTIDDDRRRRRLESATCWMKNTDSSMSAKWRLTKFLYSAMCLSMQNMHRQYEDDIERSPVPSGQDHTFVATNWSERRMMMMISVLSRIPQRTTVQPP